jgi:hypothetical protein
MLHAVQAHGQINLTAYTATQHTQQQQQFASEPRTYHGIIRSADRHCPWRQGVSPRLQATREMTVFLTAMFN